MAEIGPRPKVSDGVMMGFTLVLMGVPAVVPNLGPLLGKLALGGGLIGVFLWPVYRWVPYYWRVFRVNRKNRNVTVLLTGVSATATAGTFMPVITEGPIERDVWLQDGVCYALHGRWLGEDEPGFPDAGDMQRAVDVSQKMRELAGDGKFNIWGKEHPMKLYELIPSKFWVDHQVDILDLIGRSADHVRTETVTSRRDEQRYFGLMVSRVQVEKLWPPASLPGRQSRNEPSLALRSLSQFWL